MNEPGKGELRRRWYELAATLEEDRVARDSAAAAAHLLAWPPWHDARTVALYRATPRELSLEQVLQAAWREGKRVAVPARRDDRTYAWAWAQPDTPWRAGAFGIAEPAVPVWTNPLTLELILVPGVAFDRSGNRLGHGAGFLDRMLVGLPARLVGCALDEQLVPRVPAQEHDIPMHALCTPSGMIEGKPFLSHTTNNLRQGRREMNP